MLKRVIQVNILVLVLTAIGYGVYWHKKTYPVRVYVAEESDLIEALKNIVIPVQQFKNASYHDAIEFYSDSVKPATNVNIVYDRDLDLPLISYSAENETLSRSLRRLGDCTLTYTKRALIYGDGPVDLKQHITLIDQSTESLERERMLNESHLPQVMFREANIYDIVDFLSEIVRAHQADNDHFLKMTVDPQLPLYRPGDEHEPDIYVTSKDPFSNNGSFHENAEGGSTSRGRSVTMKARYMSAYDVLAISCWMSGTRAEISKDGIVIVDALE